MIDPARLQIVASVPVTDLSRVEAGQQARVRGPGSSAPEEATVIGRPAAVDPSTAAAVVRLSLARGTRLPAGTPVEVTILGDEHRDALLVPASAIVHEGTESFVVVVERGGEGTGKAGEEGGGDGGGKQGEGGARGGEAGGEGGGKQVGAHGGEGGIKQGGAQGEDEGGEGGGKRGAARGGEGERGSAGGGKEGWIAHRRKVEVGIVAGGEAEILSGVRADEPVITQGQEALPDGAAVIVSP